MAKLLFIPKLDGNFARSIYLGLLCTVFVYCVAALINLKFGFHFVSMVVAACMLNLLIFSYLIYIYLDLQDQVNGHHKKDSHP